MNPSFAGKVRFFDQLEPLGEPETDSGDEEVRADRDKRQQFKTFLKSRRPTSPRPSAAAVEEQSVQLKQTESGDVSNITYSRAQVVEATPLTEETRSRQPLSMARDGATAGSFVEESPAPGYTRAAHSRLQKSTTDPSSARSPSGEDSSPAGVRTRKRKRNSLPTAKATPEEDQIFRGLAFYYIPNNDVAPHRKAKIKKAQQYGAQWAKSLHEATHAVVDKNLVYKDVENVLVAASPSLIVVNEDYPIDSISFRSPLNPEQHRYTIPGYPPPTEEPASNSEQNPQSSQASHTSLPLKSPQNRPRAERSGQSAYTPRHGEESSLEKHEDNRQDQHSPQISGTQTNGTENNIGERSSETQIPKITKNTSIEFGRRPSDNIPSDTCINDELKGYISIVREYKDLPLDEDDDTGHSLQENDSAASDSDADADSPSGSQPDLSLAPNKRAQKSAAFEEHFACNRGGTKDKDDEAANPNARTIEVLQSMCDYYTRINDHWRMTAYRRAISTLRRQPTKITTEEEAGRLPAIGPRLAQKIDEIVRTDGLRRLTYARDEPYDRVLATFLGIYDVGTSRASRWIAQGHRTLDDLRRRAALTPNQRLGLERYDDLNTRIPRAEVAAMAEYVRAAAAGVDGAVELLVGGSYRRGADTSGDVDFIVTKGGTHSAADLEPFLETLLDVLARRSFVVARLQTRGGSQWHGCCALPQADGERLLGPGYRPVWRRVDFLLVPETEYGAALLYFTGNDIFNRSMRLLASRKGMRLNQRGLYKEVIRDPQRAKVTEGELVEARDEKRIFEALGVQWREPGERWC